MRYSTPYIIKRLFKEYTRPKLKLILAAIFFMLIFAASKPAQLAIIKKTYENILHHQSIHYSDIIPLEIFALAVIAALASYFSTIIMSRVGYGIVNNMQKDMFKHVIGSDMELHYKNSSGDFISRITNDINLIRSAVSDVIIVSIKQFFSLAGIIAYILYQDWRLFFVALAILFIVVYPLSRVAKRLRKIARVGQEQSAKLTTRLAESFGGIRVVKAYNSEDFEEKRLSMLIDKTYTNKIKSVQVSNINGLIFTTLSGMAAAAIVWYIGHTHDEEKHAVLITSMIGLTMLFKPIRSIGSFNNTMQNALAAAERFYTMIDLRPQVVSNINAPQLKINSGEVKLENLTFAYTSEHEAANALENLSLTIPAGKKVALVGHSGSGKSTVINLILRFFDPQGGNILIDGQDIKNIDITSLRNNISLVTQDVFLFDDTIAANIAYGSGEPNSEEIENAAKVAMADEFINKFPEGYETRVGENGIRLSGGQKQRISIARAILRNAPILLLDEATSSLDRVAEAEFHEALDRLVEGRTTLIVAHRLSTIINADLIYLIDQGRIIASGTHQELLKKSPDYQKLFNL